jgi:hypothetical protein
MIQVEVLREVAFVRFYLMQQIMRGQRPSDQGLMNDETII